MPSFTIPSITLNFLIIVGSVNSKLSLLSFLVQNLSKGSSDLSQTGRKSKFLNLAGKKLGNFLCKNITTACFIMLYAFLLTIT